MENQIFALQIIPLYASYKQKFGFRVGGSSLE